MNLYWRVGNKTKLEDHAQVWLLDWDGVQDVTTLVETPEDLKYDYSVDEPEIDSYNNVRYFGKLFYMTIAVNAVIKIKSRNNLDAYLIQHTNGIITAQNCSFIVSNDKYYVNLISSKPDNLYGYVETIALPPKVYTGTTTLAVGLTVYDNKGFSINRPISNVVTSTSFEISDPIVEWNFTVNADDTATLIEYIGTSSNLVLPEYVVGDL